MCEASIELFQLYEFSLMMTSLVISLLFYGCGCANKICWVVSLILNVTAIGLMEMVRNTNYMVSCIRSQ